jgi:hypothetical protein
VEVGLAARALPDGRATEGGAKTSSGRTTAERAHCDAIARGSALECAAILDVLVLLVANSRERVRGLGGSPREKTSAPPARVASAIAAGD